MKPTLRPPSPRGPPPRGPPMAERPYQTPKPDKSSIDLAQVSGMDKKDFNKTDGDFSNFPEIS